MKTDWRAIVVAIVPIVAFAVMLAVVVGVALSGLDEAGLASLHTMVEDKLPAAALVAVSLAILVSACARWAWGRFAAPLGKLAEEVDVLHKTGVDRELTTTGSASTNALVEAVNGLVRERTAMRVDFDAKVRATARGVDEERERLAALMSELTQSVVVCNLDGQILLYNERARQAFKALSVAPSLGGGTELIGLGRSIYAVMDRGVVAHAIESVRLRLARGAATPHAQFVTSTNGGQLLRVQLAPVRTVGTSRRGDAPPANRNSTTNPAKSPAGRTTGRAVRHATANNADSSATDAAIREAIDAAINEANAPTLATTRALMANEAATGATNSVAGKRTPGAIADTASRAVGDAAGGATGSAVVGRSLGASVGTNDGTAGSTNRGAIDDAATDAELLANPVDVSLAGFVLTLVNITREFSAEAERDRMLHALTEASRGSLGNLQAAVEILDDPDLDAETHARFQAVVREEVSAMSQRIQDLARHTTQAMRTRWPLDTMPGAELLAAAVRRIESATPCLATTDGNEVSVWVEVDGFSVVEVLAGLAQRLADDYDVRSVRLRLSADHDARPERARLDLVWAGRATSNVTLTGWDRDSLRIGSESIPTTVRDVVERHDGGFWFERERTGHESFFRFLLPIADDVDESVSFASDEPRIASRPEYYDFDLFRTSGPTRALDDRRLSDITYTVFDTETTGLDPSAGDEIIQVGATRIVAGKLRRQETFEQLVDPHRELSPENIAVHGITPAMLAGQPSIEKVLPAFHAFSADTVLVAHNAAFDMRFLQMKEASTGVRFEQPVLDTLLLSPLLHPQQTAHGLEAIAERLGVSIMGRHTALGDAMVTAEVFLRMIPLLEAIGLKTLGQVLEAARKSYFARVKY